MIYTLEIDLSSPSPQARVAGTAANAAVTGVDISEPLEIGQVTSPNSPTGATWAVEEILVIAERLLGDRPVDVVIEPPPHWGPTNRQAFAASLTDAGLRATVTGQAADPAPSDPLASSPPAEPARGPEVSVPTPPPLADPPPPAALEPSVSEPALPPVTESIRSALPAVLPAAPSPAELYNLPHINDEPLPDFVLRRRSHSEPLSVPEPRPAPEQRPAPQPRPAQMPASQPAQPAPASHPATALQPAAQPGPTVPPMAPTVQPRQSEPAWTNQHNDAATGRGALVFILAFVVVAIGFSLLLLTGVIGGSDDTDGSAAGGSSSTVVDVTVDPSVEGNDAAEGTGDPSDDEDSTTPSDDSTTDGAERTCGASQFPQSGVRYRVSDIPARFEAQTLNGRNVPSVAAVDGVNSRVITEFPEFSELDLDTARCQLNENGRPWWAVAFTDGPEGIAWASTLYIEPVPAEDG